jgi:hypothetical protein
LIFDIFRVRIFEIVVSEIRPHQKGRRPKIGEWRIVRRKDGAVDGRSLRRTGRDVLFAAKVSETFGPTIKEIAAREKRTVGAVLEDALRLYRLSKKPKRPRAVRGDEGTRGGSGIRPKRDPA